MRNMRRTGRPYLKRKIEFAPEIRYFKPQGIRMARMKIVELTTEELEAIRLKNVQILNQKECAEKMNTSSATFQRILTRANQKIATALIEGNAIKIIDSEFND
jgi:predicted DNA-binding protein (UPF0251 family)